MLDGAIARIFKSNSEFGARLDTFADIIFIAVCCVKILPLMKFPLWLWIWIAVIAIIKVYNILWGLISNKRIIAIHSIMNKTTGILLFLLPLTLYYIELKYSYVVLSLIATLAAIQEVHYVRMGRDII